MLKHHLLFAFRNFRRYKTTFFINLVGLSTGLACALFIYLWADDEISVDTFFEKDTQLYQVMKTHPNANGSFDTSEETPSALATTMLNDVPEVLYSVSTISRNPGIMTAGDKHMKAKPMFADKNFFDVFSYTWIKGNRQKALSEKYGIIVTDKFAQKMFDGTDNILGKTIAWNGENAELNGAYTITGIVEAPPPNASVQFDVLFTYALYFDTYKDQYGLTLWYSNSSHTFVLLKEGSDVSQLNERLKDYSKAKLRSLHGPEGLEWEGKIFLQRYSTKYLFNEYENGVPAGGRIEYVRLFFIVAIFVLAIACINFMNLSTAQATRRMKEIGVKKTMGITQRTLLFQYIWESFCMALMSFIVAMVLFVLLLPAFNIMTGKQLIISVELIVSSLAIAIATGIIAGSYPAFYLSAFKPVAVLKGQMYNSTGESWIRKGLVIFQFSISIVLMVSVVVVYKQIEFVQTKNLGYSKDNIIIFTNEGKLKNHMDAFLEEVKTISGVVNASSMGGNLTGDHGGGGGVDWEGKLPGEGVEFDALYANFNLMELLDLKMAEGRTFSKEFQTDRESVIFNEAAIGVMRLKEPVGKTVMMWGKERKIIGVVKDFHYQSLYNTIQPFFFRMPSESDENENVLVKIQAGTERETIACIKKMYESFNDGLAFEYKFMDDDFQKLYAAELRVSMLSKYFSGMAILISCLGLFGLAAFTAEKRTKEIGIRKVLGSTVFGIVYLLSTEFSRIVLSAIVIALPLSYFLAKYWLDSFAFRIELQSWYFLAAGILALCMAWITVGSHAIRAARANPVNSLRTE